MGINYNQWKQVNLAQNILWQLAKNGKRSLRVARNNEADYTALNRHTAGDQDGDLWVNWSWDYVSQSRIAPRWWR